MRGGKRSYWKEIVNEICNRIEDVATQNFLLKAMSRYVAENDLDLRALLNTYDLLIRQHERML